jgi:two-component system response regulator HydG
MYLLVMRSGGLKGSAWPVTEQPLVIGRGRACDIVIPDPLTSRRHCEIALVGELVELRDLGSSNLTLVNGEPVQQRILRSGDEIAIGPAVFMLIAAPEYAPPPRKNSNEDSTCAVATTDLVGSGGEVDAMGRLQTVQDYTEIFGIFRGVSQVSTVADLMERLRKALEPRFEPTRVWIARFHAQDEAPTFYPPLEAAGPESERVPLEVMRQAFEERRPLGKSARTPASNGMTAVLAAPMAVGQEWIGVLCLRTARPGTAQDDAQLGFLAALAHQIAPLFHSIALLEALRRENERLREQAGESAQLVGESKAIRHVRGLVREAARTQLPVLILGETGTGKELVARRIHDLSPRAGGPFVAMNCAAIPAQLFESELFGHEKGAFTDASYAKPGRMEQAHGGTLFLDEVGDLSLENQARILRAIEEGTFHRVGAQHETRVDIRVVAATNEDVPAAIENGLFRLDLYHRLNGFQIEIPPLRERPSDIPILAEHFLKIGRERAKHPIKGFHPDAVAYLQSRMWPGNVRELRNCIDRAIARARHDMIVVEDLHLPGAALEPKRRAKTPTTLAEMEKEHLTRILRECRGNVSAAARVLEIHRNTLYNKISQYGIEV